MGSETDWDTDTRGVSGSVGAEGGGEGARGLGSLGAEALGTPGQRRSLGLSRTRSGLSIWRGKGARPSILAASNAALPERKAGRGSGVCQPVCCLWLPLLAACLLIRFNRKVLQIGERIL